MHTHTHTGLHTNREKSKCECRVAERIWQNEMHIIVCVYVCATNQQKIFGDQPDGIVVLGEGSGLMRYVWARDVQLRSWTQVP